MSGNARDKLYNDYLRRKMGCIASTVKVRQIIPYLPCLTSHDRGEIEAKRDTCGNYNAMQLLLACLRVRDNWPEEFILALEACEHTTMAAEMRQEYDSLRDQVDPNPPALAAHVVTAHVHPPPPPSPPPNQASIPESADNNQAAVEAPPLTPPEPAAQVSPPASTQPESQSETPPSLADEASAKTVSSDPAPQAPQSPQQVTPNASTDMPLSPPPETDSDETFKLPVEETPDPEPPVEVTPHTEHSVEESPDPPFEVNPHAEHSVEETPDPEPPVEGAPPTEPSVEETPEPPVEGAPPTEPSIEETPEPPVEGAPPTEPSVEETHEPLVDETPDTKLPVEETPELHFDETSVEEAPNPENPVDESLDHDPSVYETPNTKPPVEETPEPQASVEVTLDGPVEETPGPEPPVEETPDPGPPVGEICDLGRPVEETLEPKASVEVVAGPPAEETPDPEPIIEETHESEPPVDVHAVSATLQPHPIQSATLEVSPPKSPSPQTDLDETDTSTCTVMPPGICLVQDTTPPEGKGAPNVLETEEHSAPIAIQTIQNGLDTDSTATTTIPAEDQNALLCEEDDVHVNKPGLLSNEEPYSDNTACLESSEATADSELTTQVSAPAVACSDASLLHQAALTTSPPSCQENGVVEELLPHYKPEESLCQSSLGDHSILVHAVHVSELPSIQNQNGHMQNAHASETQPVQNNSEPEIVNENPSVSTELPPHSCEDNQCEKEVRNGASMSEEPQLSNGQATSTRTKVIDSVPELAASAVTVSFNAASNDNCYPSESRAAVAALELKPQDPMDKKPWSSIKSSHTKYFVTAAGVGACALFMAWKLKH